MNFTGKTKSTFISHWWSVILVTLFVPIGIAWLDHTRETILPIPSGPLAVGRATCVWSDAAQADPMAPRPDAKRELVAWIWYPAASQPSLRRTDDYLPAPWLTAGERQRNVLLNLFLTRDLSRVRTHSFQVMRGGLAALVTSYTSLAEDLPAKAMSWWVSTHPIEVPWWCSPVEG